MKRVPMPASPRQGVSEVELAAAEEQLPLGPVPVDEGSPSAAQVAVEGLVAGKEPGLQDYEMVGEVSSATLFWGRRWRAGRRCVLVAHSHSDA